jgi:hypothetical protein
MESNYIPYLSNFLFWVTCGFVSATVYGSFFEWILHRFVMHRPVGKFDYAFCARAIVHHHTFKADHTYHVIDGKDKKTIPRAWWNGPVLIAFTQIPFLIASSMTGSWGVVCGSLLACCACYGAYE